MLLHPWAEGPLADSAAGKDHLEDFMAGEVRLEDPMGEVEAIANP
jgi:hypothetical protein